MSKGQGIGAAAGIVLGVGLSLTGLGAPLGMSMISMALTGATLGMTAAALIESSAIDDPEDDKYARKTTYGIKGQKGVPDPTAPVQMGYGTIRAKGQVISAHVNLSGGGVREQQSGFNLLIGFGEGEISSFSGVEIDSGDLGDAHGFDEETGQVAVGIGNGTKREFLLPHADIVESSILMYVDGTMVVGQVQSKAKKPEKVENSKSQRWLITGKRLVETSLVITVNDEDIDDTKWAEYYVTETKDKWYIVLTESFKSSDKKKSATNPGLYVTFDYVDDSDIKFIAKRSNRLAVKFPQDDVPEVGEDITATYTTSKYGKLEWDFRLGTQHQKVLSGFGKLRSTYDVSEELEEISAETFQTNGEVDDLTLGIIAPRGLIWLQEDEGSLKAVRQTVSVNVFLRTLTANRNNIFGQESSDGNSKWVQLHDSFTSKDKFAFHGKTSSAKRFEVNLGSQYVVINGKFELVRLHLERDYYEIKVVRIDPDKPHDRVQDTLAWDYVTEIKNEQISYPHTALLAIRGVATDEVSGEFPEITALLNQRLVYNYSTGATEFSRSPAWAVADMITSKRGGLGDYYNTSNIHTPSLIEWHDFCTTRGYTINTLINTQYDALDLIAELGTTARCMPVLSGGDTWKFVVDQDEAVSQAFVYTEGSPETSNITADTLVFGKLPLDKQPNYIEISYLDEDNDYEPELLLVQDQTQVDDLGVNIRPLAMRLIGVTSFQQAREIGLYTMYSSKYASEWCKFAAPISSVVCEPGDIVTVTHPIPGWTAKKFRVIKTEYSDQYSILLSMKAHDTRAYPEVNDIEKDYEISRTNYGEVIGTPASSVPALPVVSSFTAEDID